MKIKVFLVFVIFYSILLPGILVAQNKVVVIPLSETHTNIYGGGWIRSDGSIVTNFGRSFTVQHRGNGLYYTTIPGLRPNCVGPMPIIQLTTVSGGYANISTSIGTNYDTGDTTFQVQTGRISDGIASPESYHIVIMLSESFSGCSE
jgi:hypothetical protein